MDRHMSKRQCQNAYPCKYLDEKQLCAWLGISRSTIRGWIGKGAFPEPVTLGQSCVRWLKADIEAWEAEQVA